MGNYLMRVLLVSLLLFFSTAGIALNYSVPASGRLVGAVTTAQVGPQDDYPTVAERYDLGYYELYEANPGINPDTVMPGTLLIIPRQYILPAELKFTRSNIVINLASMRLYYFNKTKDRIYNFPVGIGKEGWVTPTGKFTISQKIKHPIWFVPKSIQKYREARGDAIGKYIAAGPSNPMGNYALRLSDPSYLIHGTDDPVGVGRRSSAGCIRMYPEDIKKLFHMVQKGTPVTIINQPLKIDAFQQKLYLEAHMPLYEQRETMRGNYAPLIKPLEQYAAQHQLCFNSQQALTIVKQHLGIPWKI